MTVRRGLTAGAVLILALWVGGSGGRASASPSPLCVGPNGTFVTCGVAGQAPVLPAAPASTTPTAPASTKTSSASTPRVAPRPASSPTPVRGSAASRDGRTAGHPARDSTTVDVLGGVAAALVLADGVALVALRPRTRPARARRLQTSQAQPQT